MRFRETPPAPNQVPPDELDKERRLVRALLTLCVVDQFDQAAAQAALLATASQWATYVEVHGGHISTTAAAGEGVGRIDGPTPIDPTWQAVLEGSTQTLTDPAQMSALGHHFVGAPHWRSLVMVPIHVGAKVAAILVAGKDVTDPAWAAEAAETLGERLLPAWQAGIRQDRKVRRLEAAADVDALTGALTAQGFTRRLPLELSRAARNDTALTLLFIAPQDLTDRDLLADLDARVALADFTERVTAVLRDVDIVARVGETRLGLLMPGCDHEQAEGLLPRLSAALEWKWPYTLGGTTWNRMDSPHELIERAEHALYLAQQGPGSPVILKP